ncbi:MAG: hypothetical protein PHN69_04680 [Candidatus Pacebacteria bacterium]|nr:hypothetical protein [Candidatus Paceibacterota bacterium]
MIELTPRDKELFNLISISGTCTYEQAAKIFEKPGGYHYKRIRKLCKEGYLIKRSKYLELTTLSSEIVGDSKYRFIKDDNRKAHAEVTNIALSGLSIKSNRTIRSEYGLNRKTHFKGAIIHKGLDYFFYLLPPVPTSQYISFIKSELKTYSSSGICRHAVVFAPTPTAIGMFTVDDCRQNELFLLPYPMGMKYLQNYFTDSIQNHIGSLLPPVRESKHKFANYEDDQYYYSVLVLNDLSKRHHLNTYYISAIQDKPVKIICLQSQVTLFSNVYPNTQLIIMQEEIIQAPVKLHQVS